jgi:hypothetical protein
MAERIGRAGYLDHVDDTQFADALDIFRAQLGRVDAPEPAQASE